MKAQIINSNEDINWLFETHLKDNIELKSIVKSAIIIGNEDAPNTIELYDIKEIMLEQSPIHTINLGE